MNKGKQNKPLQVALHGMDGRSYNTMVKFLQGPCKGAAFVVEELNAEVDIVDADLSNSKKILEQRLANKPLRPIIILSLQEKNLDSTIFVRKPVQTDAMIDAFSDAKKMLLVKAGANESKSPSRQVKRIKKQVFDTSEKSPSEQNKQTQPSDNSDEQRKSSKHGTAMLTSILNELNGTSADIEASGVISTDGLMMASVLPAVMDEDRVGAMSAAMLSLGDRTAQELARGTLEQVLIKGDNGYVLMTYAGDEAVLTVMAKSNAKLGLIFLDVKRAAESVSELL